MVDFNEVIMNTGNRFLAFGFALSLFSSANGMQPEPTPAPAAAAPARPSSASAAAPAPAGAKKAEEKKEQKRVRPARGGSGKAAKKLVGHKRKLDDALVVLRNKVDVRARRVKLTGGSEQKKEVEKSYAGEEVLRNGKPREIEKAPEVGAAGEHKAAAGAGAGEQEKKGVAAAAKAQIAAASTKPHPNKVANFDVRGVLREILCNAKEAEKSADDCDMVPHAELLARTLQDLGIINEDYISIMRNDTQLLYEHILVREKKPKALRALLAIKKHYGIDCNSGSSSLYAAVKAGCKAGVEMRLREKINPNGTLDFQGFVPASGADEEMRRILHEHGVEEKTPLALAVIRFRAAVFRHEDTHVWEVIIDLLLHAGATIDCSDANLRTPLHYLCCKVGDQDNLEMVKKFLEAGADSGIQDKDGKTAYKLAMGSESYRVAGLLVMHMQVVDQNHNIVVFDEVDDEEEELVLRRC